MTCIRDKSSSVWWVGIVLLTVFPFQPTIGGRSFPRFPPPSSNNVVGRMKNDGLTGRTTSSDSYEPPCWENLSRALKLKSRGKFTGEGIEVNGDPIYFVRYDGGKEIGTLNFNTKKIRHLSYLAADANTDLDIDFDTVEILRMNPAHFKWVDYVDPKVVYPGNVVVIAPKGYDGNVKLVGCLCRSRNPEAASTYPLGIVRNAVGCLTRNLKDDHNADIWPYAIATDPLSKVRPDQEPQLIPSCPYTEPEPEANCSEEFETKLAGALDKIQIIKGVLAEAETEVADLKEACCSNQ